MDDRDLAELPPEVVRELSLPVQRRIAFLIANCALKPVFRGSPGNFRYVGTRWAALQAAGGKQDAD